MLKKLFRYIFRGELYRNSAKLFFGHATGQGLVFLSGPLLSRLYNPEAFGAYALMSSIAALISVFATGSYEFAIITVKKEREAQGLSLLAIILSFAASAVSAIILSVLFYQSEAWQHHISGAGWGLIPVFVLLQGLYNTANYTLNRHQNYNTMSAARTSRAAVMVPVQIALGLKNLSFGLFLGMNTGHLAGLIIQSRKTVKKQLQALKTFKLKELKTVAIANKKFPKYLMPEELINSFSAQSPLYLLKIFFDQASVGLYALPHKFLSAPIVLIGNSLGQIYFRDAALKHSGPNELAQVTLKLFHFLFRLGVIPFSVLMVFGDIIIEFVFGSMWEASGIYAMLLSPWLFFVLIGSPLSNIFTVKGQQKKSLLLNTAMMIFRILALLAGSLIFNNAVVSIALFSGVGFVFWFFIAFYNLKLAGLRVLPVMLKTLSIWLSVLAVFSLIRFYFI